MAEAPKDRFRRLIKELSEDDRTFLDTNLLGVYRKGIDYGKVQGFFSESEARTYRGVADQRLQAIRKIPVLDQSGQPITKTVDVPIMRDGKQTTIKRTTPLNPFDLQKKTGGQMEGGALTGPIFTGRSLTGEGGLQDVVAQRVKLKEQIAPAIQQDAQQIEQKRGLTALNKPGTVLGLLAGGMAAPFVGASKDYQATVMRGAGVPASEIARRVYGFKSPEIDNPFALGVEHAGIFGQTLEESVLPSIIGTGAGILTGGAAATLAAPSAPFTAGLGPAAAALLVGMPTAYAATELAQKGQQAVKKAILGDDVYEARKRQMQEATTANPYGAIGGQMAANFAVASPTLPSLSLLKGGLAAGKTGANVARAEQAMINAGIPAQAFRPQLPTTGLGGVVSNSKFYNLASGAMEGAITSKLGQSLRLNTTRGAIRGFTGSEQGREFISDIAERGIEGMTDFQQAMAQREKDKIAGRPETPLYQIMAQTLFGSLFEGRGPASKAFDFTGRVGQNLGTTALRAMGDTTSSDFVPLGRMAPVPSKKQSTLKATTVGATGVTSPTAPTSTMFERMELPQNIVPMGRGRVAEINREGFTSNVKSVLDLPADYLDIRMNKGPGQVDMSENVYNAVSRLAPDAGVFSRVKEAFTGPAPLKAEKVGDAFEQLSGFTDDGFAKVNVIRPDGESTYNLVSLDMLSPSNRKKAEKVMTDSGITPASITGYTKSDVQRDIAKNFELRSTTDPSLKDNFKNEFWMGDTLVPGRIVSKVDDQHVVMQLPSPTSGVDMVIVPNVNVERMGQPQEILDTRTITPYNPSEFTVDKESYSPLRKDVDRISTKDLKHPMMLTPEQASRAGRSRQLIIDKKRELVAAGEDAKSINQKADASIKAATNEMLAKTRTPAEFAFDEGTLIEFRDASGQLKMGVVVDNTPYGPVVVDADAPSKPAFVVQESSIERTSVPMRNIPKTETETPPRTTEEAVSRRTGRKRKASTTATTVVPDVVAEAKTEVGVETPEKKTRRRRRTATPVVAESVIENVAPDAEAEVSTTRTRKATPTVTPEVTPPVVRPTPTPVTRKTRATSKRQIEALLKDGVVIDGVDVEFPKIPYETATLSEDIDPATGKRKLNKTRGNSVILDFSGRKLIVADINGVRIPFYLSTGYGGKADVPPGKWYPVFGIDPMSGWFNKTSGTEITSYYGNPDLRAVSEHLDNTIGDVRDVQVPKVAYRLEGKVTPQIDFINRDVTPVTNERPETAQELRQNINDALAKVEEAVTEEVIEEPVVEAQVTPTEGVQPTPTPVTPAPAPQVTPSTVTTAERPGVVAVRPELQLSPDIAIQLFPQVTGPAIVNLERTDDVTGIPEIIGTNSRFITVLNIKGQEVLYYLSSGENPKMDAETGEVVEPGKWYPFFGLGPEGWLNKPSSRMILDSLGQQEFKDGSDLLNNHYGDIRSLQTNDPDFMTTPKEELPNTNNIFFTELNEYNTTVVPDKPRRGKYKPILDRINSVVQGVGRKSGLFPDHLRSELTRLRQAWDAYDARKGTPVVEAQPVTREVIPQDIIDEGSFFTPTAEVELTPTQQTMVEEGDESATDEGSYLENVQPGDVTVAEGDSLVRVRASVEGIGDIDEVLAKARNREELEVVLKDTLIRSGQIKSDADATTAARAVSAYYDEMIHAFVNRDLYIAQLVMQGIDDITPVVRKSVTESGQPLAPSVVDANLSYAAKKVAWKRNRTAALIQKHDMPRINSIIESINDEASSRQTSLNELTGEYFVTKGTKFSDIRSEDTQRSIIDNVRVQLIRQRYKTNIPVFKVIDSGPRLDSAYDDIFEKRGGYTTIVDERTNTGQQVVFLMANNSDIGTTVHELSHAILDNMPVHMAGELATRFGKTLRKPTKLNESYIPWEMHEMFATAMEQSFLSGTPPTAIGGSASGQNRVNDIWDKISKFMRIAYADVYGFKDASNHVNWKENRLEWAVPYDNNTVFLWDKIPITVKLGDTLVRATVLKTDKFPAGPGLIPDGLVTQPMVSVKFHDPVDGLIKTDSIDDANAFGKADIRPADIVSVGGITKGMSANLGSMMVKWVSGYSTQTDTYGQRVSLIGLRDTYTDTNEQIIADNPQGLFDTIATGDRSINKLIDKAIEEDKGGIDRTSSKWKGYLFGIGNRSMSAVNRALNYGLVTTLPTDTSYTNFNDWINAIGSLRQGQFLKEYNYTDSSGKTVKKNALEWVQSGWRDLSNEIKSLEPYQGALELQGRERRAAAQRRSGNTGGNVLYQSRRRSADATLRKEAAQRIAGNSNPHSITPEAFAHYATYDGVPREVVSQFIDTRVGADALRTFDGTADIRTLEVDDVLIIDGTIDASGDTLASMKNAIDFAQRNGIDNFLMHTQAGKTEPLGYSDKGYSVEPTVTFTSPEVIADDIYASVRREYPAIRISPDRKSVTMVHLEDRGKTYEESLENFGKAIEKVSSKFIEADVPVQGFQSTERVWNFGNESGRGYAIDYNEARNVLNLTAPHLFGVDDKPKFDLTVRPTIEGALSLVRGKTVNIPAKFDMSIAPDTHERWVEFGNQHSKLPSQYYPNTDSKRVYTALTKELPKQFKFLELSVGFIGSGKPSKVTVKQDARVDERNPMLADSGLTTVDGEPLKFSEVADAIYSSIRSSVGVVSGGEHSDNLAFAAHASLTQDPFAIWGLWSETIGRRANGQFSTSDIRRTGLPPLDTLKTGVVGIDKRIDTLYKDSNNEFGHLGIKDSNNAYSPASFASGRGVTLFSSRKREAQSWYENGGPAGRDFTTHQSPDTAIDSLFVSANNKDWTFSSDVIKQLSDRNSALIQMFGGNRDHAIQYLKEAVIANVSMTGNRNAGINALEELGVREDLTDTTFDTNESYVKKRIKPLKSFINPVDGKVKLYHASNNVIDIDTGGLVTANTLSRVNGNMDATLAGLSMLEPKTSNLGGTPSVTSMTYDIRYALDIAKVANNFRNVLLDSSKIIDWRKSANDRIKTAILSYKEGDSYVSDRVRKMSGIDNPNVPSTYKSMLNEIANDNHSLDVLALTSAKLDSSNDYVRNGYEKAFADIDALMPIVSKVDSDAASNIQDVVTWMKSNQKPVKDKRDIDGVNPVYLVAYANLKAKRFSTTNINDMYDNTIEMLESGKDIRREAIRVLGSIEDNHSSLGLPSAYMTDFSLKGIADMTPDELSKRSIGILEYDVSPSLLVEHNPDEVEVRSYAPSSFGTPSKVYTPDGNIVTSPTTKTYKTLWSARPIKPPVRIQTVVDEDGTVTEVREEIPVEASDKVKKALKITEWVMTPYGIVNDLARNSVGGDWSSILIQNWMTANPIENPKLFGQQFLIGMKMMKPNLGFQKKDGTIINQDMMLGRQEFHELGDQIRSNTFYSLAKDAGLILNTARVDERLAKLRETDPRATLMNVDELGMDKDLAPTHAFMKHGPLQGASERTMTMTKDYVKMMKFNQGIQHYIEIGYNPRSSKFIDVAKDYAGLLNVAQGDIKFTEDKDMDDLIGRNLRNLMFAPRWLSSRFMFDPLLRGAYTFVSPNKGTKLLEINRMYKKYGEIDPYVRAENNRLYMKSAAMFSFLGLLLSRFNPFGELAVETEVTGMGTVIRVGDYTFKAPGGALYHMELINTIVKGIDTRPGETTEERLEKTSDQLKMLIMSKAAPAVSLVSDMVTGRNIIGEPSRETYRPLQTYWNQVTRPALQTVGLDMPPPRISNLVADRFFYLWAQDALDTYDAVSGRGGQYPGVEAGAVAALAFIGGRVRYAPKELKWQYRANDNDNPVPGWEYTFSGVDGDAFFEEQARNVQ